MAETTNNKWSAKNRLHQGENGEPITKDMKGINKPPRNEPGSKNEGNAPGRLGKEKQMSMQGGHNAPMGKMTIEEQERRTRENNAKKIKDIIANKDIYELTDEEKELFIMFFPDKFYHGDEDLGTAEFFTTSPIAELVLSDYFIKKERTKGMDFLFNLHSPVGDEVLDD